MPIVLPALWSAAAAEDCAAADEEARVEVPVALVVAAVADPEVPAPVLVGAELAAQDAAEGTVTPTIWQICAANLIVASARQISRGLVTWYN